MFEIRPNALYGRNDLIEGLKPLGIDADALIAKLRPIKRFRMAWLGDDLINALRKAPALSERGDAAENEAAAIMTPTRRGRPKKGQAGDCRSICGIWTREELGLGEQ